MKLYLNQFFNSGSFLGEILGSFLIMFFVLIVIKNFSNNKYQRIVCIGGILVVSIFAGQGLGNAIQKGVPVFGILPSGILSAFFYNSFNLLWSLIGAQVIGSIIGGILFWVFNFIFKEKNNVIIKEKPLTNSQFIFKEVIAQFCMLIFLLLISNATFNNGISSIDISPLIANLVSLVSIMILMIVFSNYGGFMISPLITIGEVIFYSKKKRIAIKNIAIQTITFTTLIIAIGFIYKAITWWQ